MEKAKKIVEVYREEYDRKESAFPQPRNDSRRKEKLLMQLL